MATLCAPVKTFYCEQCGMPPEFCEYGPDFKTHCQPWLTKKHPAIAAKLYKIEGGSKPAAAEKVKKESKPKAAAAVEEGPPPTNPWTLEERLTNFYKKYEPTKADPSSIQALLTKYSGKEENLFTALVKKYGAEPLDPYLKHKYGITEDDGDEDVGDDDESGSDDESDGDNEQPTTKKAAGAVPTGPPPTNPWTLEERLTNYYKKYEPTKADPSSIQALLTKYSGKEENLFTALVKKYGAEPLDPYLKHKYGITDEDENGGDDDESDDESRSDDEDGGASKKMSALSMAQNLAAQKVEGGDEESAPGKKVKARGVGVKTTKKVESRVVIQKITRNRKKAVTIVVGMDTIEGLKLKDVAKEFAKRFAGAAALKDSVEAGGGKEIVIQGDHMEAVAKMVVDKYKVSKACVFLDIDGSFVRVD
jgi:density-regulated protein DRP1